MANKMSQNKQEFYNKIMVLHKDYRRNPEESCERWGQLSAKCKRKKFRVKENHFKEAAWILRDFLYVDQHSTLGGVDFGYLGGGMMRHIDGSWNIFKNGRFVGVFTLPTLVNSTLFLIGSATFFGPTRHPNVKEFFASIREARDLIKTL